MKLNAISDNPGSTRDRKRVGRGIGSGTGKTAGSGHKGQKARSGVSIKGFEGGQMPLIRRQPKRRGFKNPDKVVSAVINLSRLDEAFTAGDEVTTAVLRERGLVKRGRPVKVLGHGELTKALTVEVEAVSATARTKIEAAGGTVR